MGCPPGATAIPRPAQRRRPLAPGLTLVEVMATVVILGIGGTVALDAVSGSEANYRATRAAEETVAALRYARLLAMSTGNLCGVEFNSSLKTVSVYTMIGSTQTWVTNPFGRATGSTYQIQLATDPALLNVAMSVNMPSDATNPYDCVYNQLGATTNTGTIKFTYAQGQSTVTIASVADATHN